MTPKKSLLSRARPGKPTEKKVHGFLGLAGEIRNEVYRYYFQKGLRCELAAKGNMLGRPEVPAWRFLDDYINSGEWGLLYKYVHEERPDRPKIVRVDRIFRKYKRIHGLETSWLGSLYGLILVCKQVYQEAIFFLYHSTTFMFDAPSRIKNFLGVLPLKDLAYITKLNLHYRTYGSPDLSVDQIWKEKHLTAWKIACRSAAKKLVNLRELEIWLNTTESPLILDLRQPWLKPILQFRRLSVGRNPAIKSKETLDGLKSVIVHFHSRWNSYTLFMRALANASRDLHRLFGEAIARAILGANETEAMADFKEAWEVKYVRWQHHLNFSHTGW